MKIVLFVLSNFFVFATAVMITNLLFSKKDQWLRFLSALSLFAVEVILIELMTGLMGCLTSLVASLAAGGIFVLTGAVWLIFNRQRLLQRIFFKWLLPVPVLLIAGLPLGWFAGRDVLSGTQFCHDDLSYHATAAAHWFLEKDISAGPMNYCYYVPMNAELFSLWFLMPFGRDGMVFLAGFYWLFLAVAASAVLFRQMGINLKWLGLLLLCFCCSKDLCHQAIRTFTAVDLAGPAMVLSLLAFLACISSQATVKHWPYILLAGLCGGFAFGTKVPFTTVCFVMGLWLFFSLPGRRHVRLGYVFMFGLAALTAGSFWYVRNLVLAGNPVFPGQLGPLGGPLTSDIQSETNIIGRLVQSGFSREMIWDMIIAHVSWPYGIFLVSFAGIVSGLHRLSGPKESRKTILLILIAVFVMISTYLFMPFSAANNSPDSPLIINLRFIIGPFLLGIILFFLLLSHDARYRTIWLIVCCAGILISYVRHPDSILLPLSAGAFLWYWSYLILQRHKHIIPVQWIINSFIPGILCGLAVAYPYLQKKTDENLFSNQQFKSGVTQSWRRVNSLAPGSRVSAIGLNSYCYYPYFGRDYQNQLWTLTGGPKSYVPLHIKWKENPDSCGWWQSSPSSPEQGIKSFSSAGGEYLLVYQFLEGNWPKVHEVLTHSHIAELIDSGDGWALWKIKR